MRALITGATRGIGRACAEVFAEKGYGITAIARTEHELQDLSEAWAGYPRSELKTVVADLAEKVPPFDYHEVVILNAGRYTTGNLLDSERDAFAELFALNVLANHFLARQLLPLMVERGHGHLVAIGSVASESTQPGRDAYAVTKHMLRRLYEGWEMELQGSPVRLSLIAPGATRTSSWTGETLPPSYLEPEEVARLVYHYVAEGIEGRRVLRPRPPK